MSKLNQEILSSVRNGNLTRNRQAVKDAIASFEGVDVIIKIEKPKRKRSNQQNAFWHGVVVKIIQNCLKESGYLISLKQTHEMLKLRFLKETIMINEDTGEYIERVKSTTELSTTQFIDLIRDVQIFAIEYFNTEIPDPNEDLTLSL